jgi:hypothetical protein
MTHTPYDTQENVVVGATRKKAPSIGVSLTIAGVAAVIAIISTWAVVVKEYRTSMDAALAAVSLAAFGVCAYGLIQAVLALVDSAGERRLRDREVTERRQGERARKPKE